MYHNFGGNVAEAKNDKVLHVLLWIAPQQWAKRVGSVQTRSRDVVLTSWEIACASVARRRVRFVMRASYAWRHRKIVVSPALMVQRGDCNVHGYILGDY